MNEEFQNNSAEQESQEKVEKLSIIDHLTIAIASPKFYKDITKQPVKKTVGFVFLLTFILAFMEVGIGVATYLISVGGMTTLFKSTFPTFTITDSVMTAKYETTVDIYGIDFYFNTDIEEISLEDLENDGYYIAFGATNLAIGIVYNDETYDYGNYKYSQLGITSMSNDTLVSMIPGFYIGIVLVYIFRMIGKAINIIFLALIFTIIGSALAKNLKTGLSYGNVLRVCMYGLTTYEILNSANNCAGYIISPTILFGIGIIISFFYVGRGITSHSKIAENGPGKWV